MFSTADGAIPALSVVFLFLANGVATAEEHWPRFQSDIAKAAHFHAKRRKTKCKSQNIGKFCYLCAHKT
jgi:hypothetical protein